MAFDFYEYMDSALTPNLFMNNNEGPVQITIHDSHCVA